MYTATVLITINEFVSATGSLTQSASIDATLSPPTDTSPPPPSQPPVFSGDGESIVITVPDAYSGSVQLTFQLPDPRYVLLGVSFVADPEGQTNQEFRTIVLQRDSYGSQMSITDACIPDLDDINYEYLIIVQEVATGAVGIIDPRIETKN